MSGLADRSCVPCNGGVPPLGPAEYAPFMAELSGWNVVEGRRLEKTFKFEDFARALASVNRIGAVAEREGHHPDLLLTWGKVEARIWTHAVGGLTESDFILAAKCDRVAGDGASSATPA